jgi:hypothetical protein
MSIKINIVSETGENIEKILMNARKTIDGNILIFDHPDTNIIEDEIPYYENMEQYKKDMEQNLLEPEIDEYTEFDPSRHNTVKGTLPPRMVKYGIHSIYRL